MSEEDRKMLEWLENAKDEEILDIMNSVDKEYFN